MAIPFYENEEQLQPQQHQVTEEIDQVDGPLITNQNIPQNQSFYNNEPHLANQHTNQQHSINEEDLMAWKILALAMCKALKDHYQQNMSLLSPATTSTNAPNTSATSNTESSTAVIQILPNGQVTPQWQ